MQAKKYSITRAEVDEYATSSQKRWAAAQKAGRFTQEIVPIEIKTRKGSESFAVDEGPRPDTEVGKLGKLAPGE